MIYLITGNNTYLINQHVKKLCDDFGGDCTRIDADTMTQEKLADLMFGSTLFSTKRSVIINELSNNTLVWNKLADWSDKCSNDTQLLIIEVKPDKRTKSYKNLIKNAKLITADRWTERDRRTAEEWLKAIARSAGINLTPKQVGNMVNRAMVPTEQAGKFTIDQMQLHKALTSLASVKTIDDDVIATIMPNIPGENIFNLIEIATTGSSEQVQQMLRGLRSNEEPHKLFALLTSQWVQLVSLDLAGKNNTNAAADLGIHPYVVQKLNSLLRKFNKDQLRDLTELCAKIDVDMKLSRLNPWDGVDRLILGIALTKNN